MPPLFTSKNSLSVQFQPLHQVQHQSRKLPRGILQQRARRRVSLIGCVSDHRKNSREHLVGRPINPQLQIFPIGSAQFSQNSRRKMRIGHAAIRFSQCRDRRCAVGQRRMRYLRRQATARGRPHESLVRWRRVPTAAEPVPASSTIARLLPVASRIRSRSVHTKTSTPGNSSANSFFIFRWDSVCARPASPATQHANVVRRNLRLLDDASPRFAYRRQRAAKSHAHRIRWTAAPVRAHQSRLVHQHAFCLWCRHRQNRGQIAYPKHTRASRRFAANAAPASPQPVALG